MSKEFAMEYGIQMFSLRDMTGSDLSGALGKVAEMGYKYVEFAGFFGHSAGQIRKMLDTYGLKVIGTHSPLDDLTTRFAETVAYHKEIGNTRYIIPGHDLSSREKLDAFIAQCNEVAPKLRAEGMELYFHNHHSEFLPMGEEGYIIHSELERRCDILFELDTYWNFVAGQDPVATMERLRDRIRLIHLKDGSADGKGCSLGSGEAPVKAVLEKAVALGFGVVVESEGLDPTGVQEVERCMNYLKHLTEFYL